MSCDPREAASLLAQPEPRLDDLPRASHFFGYWFPPDAQAVELVELDASGAYVLSLIDGRRSIPEIAPSPQTLSEGEE
jgi:hypothetical protein